MGTGVFGGSFDPVHRGHIRIAKAALRELSLRTILFMPAYIPPHKQGRDMAGPQDRLRMLELALQGETSLRVSDRELRRGGVSYTVDTLEELASAGEGPLTLIVGSDTLEDMVTWRSPERIFALCRVAVFARAGEPDMQGTTEELIRRFGAEILPMSLVPPAISSTEIRARIGRGEDVRGDVEEGVLQYIREHHLYRE